MTDQHEPPRDASQASVDRPHRPVGSRGTWAAFVAGIGVCSMAVLVLAAIAPSAAPLSERDVRAVVDRAIASQVPGVTANDGNPNVKGGRGSNNKYLVNGLDMTDPVTNTFSGNFQQDSLEAVQVTTGGFEAKYNALGSIIAVQTKRGTNQFHGAASAYWAPSFLVDYKTFKLLIDPFSMNYLDNAQVDYVDGLYGAGFRISNPNASGSCGCGHSFSV